MSVSDYQNRPFGGLEAQNLDQIDAKFICQLCKLILLDPWQLLCCGTLFCQWCLKAGLPDREPFLCPYCQTKQIRKETSADRGVGREIQTIFIICYSCSWNGSYDNYLNHLQKSHVCFQCIDCDERFFAINLYEEHRQELCQYRSEPCGLPGCVDSIKSYEMKTHCLTDQHQQILTFIIMELINPQNERLKNKNSAELTRQERIDVQESINIASSACDVLISSFTSLSNEMSEMKRNLERNVPMIEELKKNEDDLDQNVQKLLQSQEHTQTELNNINAQDEKILLLDHTSSTTLSFFFPDDPSFSLTSSTFKTSNYGYPFQLRVCSTTNVFEQEYLSVFLTLCKSDFDNLLVYPFPFNIHLALWDQSSQRKHFVHVVKPADSNSSSFHRPTTEKNEEFEILQFCLLSHLTDRQSIYLKDGMFFIRVFVDFMNMNNDPFELMSQSAMVTESIQFDSTLVNQ